MAIIELDKDHILKFIGDNYLLLLILILGAVLRIYNLSFESIWLDEAYTIEISKQDPLGIIKQIFIDNENHPPLYYSIVHYWMMAFGDSEFSVRFPSVIFGVLSIAAIYKVARLLFDKNTALLSALILATSAFLIKYSQDARSYSLMVLLTLLSFYFFLKLLEHKSFRNSALYLATSLLLLYTHYYSLLLILSQNIFFLTLFLFGKSGKALSLKRWVLLQITLFVMYLPQLYLFTQASALKEEFWLKTPTIKTIPAALFIYSGSWPLFALFTILCIFAVFNPRGILRVKSLSAYIKSLYDKSGVSNLSYIQKLSLLALWLFIPILIPFFVSILIKPLFLFRYTIGGAVAFYILVAKGAQNVRGTTITPVVAGLILVFSLVAVYEEYRDVHKPQWRDAISYVESVADRGDVVLMFPSYNVRCGFYYNTRDDLTLLELSEDTLAELAGNKDSFWVINTRLDSGREEQVTKELLGDYNLESIKEFTNIKVYLYSK